MKYIKQFGIILAVTCVGEVLNYVLPLPVPAGIYGLILMLILLMTRIVPLECVKDAGGFLIEIMPLMFIPAAVGLLVTWEKLQPILFPALAITIISTFVVMIVTGKVTDWLIRMKEEKRDE